MNLTQRISSLSFASLVFLSMSASAQTEVPMEQIYSKVPHMGDLNGGKCFIRTKIAHFFLESIPYPKGNIFVFFGSDDEQKSLIDSRWEWHVAPIIFESNSRAFVLERSPWIKRPMQITEWLSRQVKYGICEPFNIDDPNSAFSMRYQIQGNDLIRVTNDPGKKKCFYTLATADLEELSDIKQHLLALKSQSKIHESTSNLDSRTECLKVLNRVKRKSKISKKIALDVCDQLYEFPTRKKYGVGYPKSMMGLISLP